jgi:hypothetical protein
LDRLELRGSQRSVALQVVPDELRRLAGDVVPVSVVGRCGLMATALGERVEPRRLPQPIYLIREPIDLMNEAKNHRSIFGHGAYQVLASYIAGIKALVLPLVVELPCVAPQLRVPHACPSRWSHHRAWRLATDPRSVHRYRLEIG